MTGQRLRAWIAPPMDKVQEKILIPLVKRIDRVLRKKINGWTGEESSPSGWKEKSLEDFRSWLDEIPDAIPATEAATPESCDLYTLLSEFSALRQEIRIQTRDQNKSLGVLSGLAEAYGNAADLLAEKAGRMSEWEARVRKDGEKRALLPFLDLRDALVRGLSASREAAASKSFLRPPPPGIRGIVEGYEMAIRRFDRAMAQSGIHPVPAMDLPFDPKTMRAVARGTVPGKDPGIVVEEHLTGFARGDEILRTAEVVVNG